MPVLMFATKFHERVENGSKLQTIRATARAKPGDWLSLRAWTGTPYRSKQRVLREAACTAVEPVAIEAPVFPAAGAPPLLIELGGVYVPDPEAFARADGFDDLADMGRWYRLKRVEVFEGWVMRWGSLKGESDARDARRPGPRRRP